MPDSSLIAFVGPISGLAELLKAHPKVEEVRQISTEGLVFESAGRKRQISCGYHDGYLLGIPELVDNNPLMCADQVWLPRPEATLVMLAAFPFLRASLVRHVVSLALPVGAGLEAVSTDCREFHLDISSGALMTSDDYKAVLELKLRESLDSTTIDELIEDAYGNSAFLSIDSAPMKTSGTPMASITAKIDGTVLEVEVSSDPQGKAGACQFIHVMNVMNGFEETLGIPTRLSR